jgi:hypothetical protein
MSTRYSDRVKPTLWYYDTSRKWFCSVLRDNSDPTGMGTTPLEAFNAWKAKQHGR